MLLSLTSYIILLDKYNIKLFSYSFNNISNFIHFSQNKYILITQKY